MEMLRRRDPGRQLLQNLLQRGLPLRLLLPCRVLRCISGSRGNGAGGRAAAQSPVTAEGGVAVPMPAVRHLGIH